MYSKVYLLKFSTINDAKLGVSFLSEEIGGAIAELSIASLAVLLDREGAVTVTVRFDTAEEMQTFVKLKTEIFDSLRKSFSMRYTEMAAIAVYTFDREAGAVA